MVRSSEWRKIHRGVGIVNICVSLDKYTIFPCITFHMLKIVHGRGFEWTCMWLLIKFAASFAFALDGSYGPGPSLKWRSFELWVRNRLVFNFWVRGIPPQGRWPKKNTHTQKKKKKKVMFDVWSSTGLGAGSCTVCLVHYSTFRHYSQSFGQPSAVCRRHPTSKINSIKRRTKL